MKLIGTIVRCATLVLAITACHEAGAQLTFTNGLFAYYPFNGDANDVTSNGNHGVTYNVTPAADRFNTPNACFQFAGNGGSHIKLTNASAVEFQGNFTVCAWIWYSHGTEGPRVFSTAGYEIARGQNALISVNCAIQGGAGVSSSNTYPAFKWQHLVWRRMDEKLALLVNGKFEGETPAPGLIDYSRGFIPEIGGNSGAPFDSFGGLIDDIRFYNRGLADEEVRSLYFHEKNGGIKLTAVVKTIRITANVEVGKTYLLESSPDASTWTQYESPFVADAAIIERDVDVTNGSRFFRVRAVPPSP